MPIGAGKYDDVVSEVMRTTQARIAMVIVIEGDRGSGTSVQIVPPVSLADLARLSDVLRMAAEGIAADALRIAAAQGLAGDP